MATVVQFFVILLFLLLGWLLYTWADCRGIDLSGLQGDDVFPYLATGGYFPTIVGILFITGFIAAAYSAAGSALTALTTSFSIDILNSKEQSQDKTTRTRKTVHAVMAVMMAICIYVIWLLNNDSVIQTVYKVASYTYGPLLGIFCFGILTKAKVRDRWIPLVAILSPILCLVLDLNSREWFSGYVFSHERLILNALFTFVGMCCLIQRENNEKKTETTKEERL